MSSTGGTVADLGLRSGAAPSDRRPGRGRWRRNPPSAPPPALVAARRVVGRVGGPALAVTYLSLLVLLPLAALITKAFSGRWGALWHSRNPPEGGAAPP